MYHAEIPGLELIFTGAFLAIARWYGQATVLVTEWAKSKLHITGGFFAYALAVIVCLVLVAVTKYLGIMVVAALLGMVGIVLPLPAFPGGVPPNTYWIILAVMSLAIATVKYLTTQRRVVP